MPGLRVSRRTGNQRCAARFRGRDARGEEIYVTAHARSLMTEHVSVCVHPDVQCRGFGHLLVGRDPLCGLVPVPPHTASFVPLEKKSAQIKRDGRRPSLIDERRSHTGDVPERRSNKARARINARERSSERAAGKNGTPACIVNTLKGSGPPRSSPFERGECASIARALMRVHSRAAATSARRRFPRRFNRD